VEGLRSRLRRDLAHAQWLKAQVDDAPDWERVAPVPLQTVFVRHVPPGMTGEEQLGRHNLAIADRINKAGSFYLTPAVLKGAQMIRVSIGSAATERVHVERLWEALVRAAGQC